MFKKFGRWWKNEVVTSLKIVSIVFFVIGVLLILYSYSLLESGHDLAGHLVLVIGSILGLHAIESLVHHYVLHEEFVKKASKIIADDFKSQLQPLIELVEELKTSVAQIVADVKHELQTHAAQNVTHTDMQKLSEQLVDEVRKMAQTEFINSVNDVAEESNKLLKHFKEAGLTNAFYGLDAEKIFQLVSQSQNKEFVIMRVFFSQDEWPILTRFLKRYIVENGCKFRIILLAPDQRTTLTQRLHFMAVNVQNDVKNCQNTIAGQLVKLYHIRESLEARYQDSLQIRVHKSHLSVAMFGMGDKILYSTYLQGKYSNEGTQIQVKEHTEHYNDLMENFETYWTNSYAYTPQPNGAISTTKPKN